MKSLSDAVIDALVDASNLNSPIKALAEYQSADYGIGVGYANQIGADTDRVEYLIVNRNTGVIEHSGPILFNVVTNYKTLVESAVALRISNEALVEAGITKPVKTSAPLSNGGFSDNVIAGLFPPKKPN